MIFPLAACWLLKMASSESSCVKLHALIMLLVLLFCMGLLHAGSMVTSICWNDGANMLAAMQDNSFVVWYHPGIVHADKDLLPLTLLTKEGR